MTFSEILSEYNIPVAPESHHHSRTGWIQFDCPFCSPDSGRWRMGYSIQGNYSTCWTCGFHSLTETLSELANIPMRKCQQLLGTIERTKIKEVKHSGKLQIPEGVGNLLPIHKRYLRDRGLIPADIKRLWQIGGIGMNTNLSWRIYIPITYKGTVVSWTTRAIGEKEILRYISANPEQEAISHKSLLFGEDYCRHGIVITEGPFDVFKIGPGAVATLGTSYTKKQVTKMIKYPIRAVCLDAEKEAQKRARELVDMLSLYPGETYNIILDTGKDPGEASMKEIKKIRKVVFGNG